MACRRMLSASETERLMLIDLVDKKKHIINDRRNQSNVNKQKHDAWEEITRQFNAAGLGPPRSIKQIRKIWEKIKGRVKKMQDHQKMQRVRIAGTSVCTSPVADTPGAESVVVISNTNSTHVQNAGHRKARTNGRVKGANFKNEEVSSSSLVSDVTPSFEQKISNVPSPVLANKVQRKRCTTVSKCPGTTEASYNRSLKFQQEHELKMEVVNAQLVAAKHSKLAYEEWKKAGQEIQKATRDIQEASKALKDTCAEWLRGLHSFEEAVHFFTAFSEAYRK